ncbi:hypothetical protein E1B28_006769 [Marasmius oreades]|uniref:Uncharacterized protein n=1 Tax=Marasmius oreades TaxID=181124 RepID=A0A9P7UWV0_9AGAR|nr:uncharacterized protein E1B28_006769 [Marasmius oreades]KAG7096093.1 hypothetical protein E1B28_006769 [Marasmius oreades]
MQALDNNMHIRNVTAARIHDAHPEVQFENQFQFFMLDSLIELNNMSGINLVTTTLHQVYKAVCSSDTNGLNSVILSFIPVKWNDDLDPRLSACKSKIHRGINHPQIAALFTPHEYNKGYGKCYDQVVKHIQANAKYLKDSSQEAITLKATQYSHYLYSKYNPRNSMDGLLMSYILLRAGHHIFAGPSAAFSLANLQGKMNNSIVLRIFKVKPEMILYTALQVHIDVFLMLSTDLLPDAILEFYYFILNTIKGKFGDEDSEKEGAQGQPSGNNDNNNNMPEL